tara:strand:+ start:85 stop:858 length:774 start_codon:yes stop_codon:yes gene_type:complete
MLYSRIEKIIKMAKKHYTPKDINKNNKLDPWEVAKYEAINSATPMVKQVTRAARSATEIDQAYRKEAADAKKDPDYLKFMAEKPAMKMLNTVDGYKHLKATAQKRMGHQMNLNSKQLNTPTAFSSYDYGVLMSAAGSEARAERDAEYGVGPNVSRGSGVVKVEYVNPAGEQNISTQEAGIVEAKSNKEPVEKADPVVITKKGERVINKLDRLQRRKELQEFKGKQRLAKGFTLGANQKRKRIANIEKREKRIKNRLK